MTKSKEFMSNVALEVNMLPYYEDSLLPYRCFPFIEPYFPPHMHSEIEIIYIKDGTMNATINDVCYSLSSGDLAILFPNVIHSYESAPHSNIYMTVFKSSFVNASSSSIFHMYCKTPVLRGSQIHDDVVFCLERLLNVQKNNDSTKVIRSYYMLLIERIAEKLEFDLVEPKFCQTSLQRLLTYVSTHYLEPITISDISYAIGLNKYYVSRLFNQQIKCSFNDYVNTLRLDYACQRLTSTTDTIASIAYDSGYTNERTFYRAFQKMYQITPKEYRKNSSIHDKV